MNRYSAGHTVVDAGTLALPLLPYILTPALYPHPGYSAPWYALPALWMLGLGLAYALILVHEFGHALTGWLVGIEIKSVTLGHWRKIGTWRIGGVPIVFRAAPATGYVTVKSSLHCLEGRRVIPFLLAGAAAETVVIAWAFLVPAPSEIYSLGDHALAFGRLMILWVGGVQVVFSLWPAQGLVAGASLANDGLQIAQFWRNRREHPATRQLLQELMAVDALTAEKRLPEARDRALDLAQRHPEKPELRQFLAQLHAACGETGQAESIFRELLAAPGITRSKAAELLDALCCLALFHERWDLLPAADAWSNEALHHVPQAITLKGTRGGVLVELGRSDEGILILDEVIKRSECPTDHVISAAYLAKAHAAKGDPTTAAKWLARARALHPEHLVVRRIAAELSGARPASPHPVAARPPEGAGRPSAPASPAGPSRHLNPTTAAQLPLRTRPSFFYWPVLAALTVMLFAVIGTMLLATIAALFRPDIKVGLAIASATSALLCWLIIPKRYFKASDARWAVDQAGINSPFGRIEFADVAGFHYGYPSKESVAMTAFQNVIAAGIRSQMDETLVLRLNDGRLLPLNLLSPSISGGRVLMATIAALLSGKGCAPTVYSAREIKALKPRPMNRLVVP